MPAPRSARPAAQETPLGFGFNPEDSTHHFLVTIPASNRQEVLISEHYNWDAASGSGSITFADGVDDGKLRVSLDRAKWNALADEVRVEFNRPLKRQAWKLNYELVWEDDSPEAVAWVQREFEALAQE